MSEKPSERREYFRIKDRAIIDLSPVLPNEKLKDLRSKHSSFLISSTINTIETENHTLHNKIKRTDPDISNYFDAINKKINLISDHLLENALDISESNLINIDISASGIAFETEKSFSQNELVLIKLLLMPEKKGVLCIGRVIRIKESNNSKILCIDFEEISESDRELIIKHTISKQLEQAREKNNPV